MITLYLIAPRGFCAGVVRAIETVDRALDKWGSPIYVKHEIVHNEHVVNRLKERGAIFFEDIEDLPEGARVIYSAHGISPQFRSLVKERKAIEIDATCGLVTRIHSAVNRYVDKGYHVILIGHENHVEVQGIVGEAPDHVTVVECVSDVHDLKFEEDHPLFLTTQTTLSLLDIDPILKAAKQRYPHCVTLPKSSICYATTNRQEAVLSVANELDVLLVVGDPMSSNSNRLRECGQRSGCSSYLVPSAKHLLPHMWENKKNIGVTAGASTPEDIVQSVLDKIPYKNLKEVKTTEENVLFSLPAELQMP